MKFGMQEYTVTSHVVDHHLSLRERYLGVILDKQPTPSAHVAALCRAGYYQLRQLRPLVQLMTAEAASTVATAFISCRLDSCNSLLYDLPDTTALAARCSLCSTQLYD